MSSEMFSKLHCPTLICTPSFWLQGFLTLHLEKNTKLFMVSLTRLVTFSPHNSSTKTTKTLHGNWKLFMVPQMTFLYHLHNITDKAEFHWLLPTWRMLCFLEVKGQVVWYKAYLTSQHFRKMNVKVWEHWPSGLDNTRH